MAEVLVRDASAPGSPEEFAAAEKILEAIFSGCDAHPAPVTTMMAPTQTASISTATCTGWASR
jgi:hypothetical protein